MRWLVETSLRFRLLVVALAVATLAIGASQLHKMPTDVLPQFGPTTVEIQTEALGLSATEVEQLVTVPMEQDLLNGVAFLDDIRSESVPGLSRILLIFKPGTDLFQARQVVAERLTQTAALPQVSKPPRMLQPLSSTNRVLMVGLSSKTTSPIDMSVLARWTIVPRLVGLRGVANVSIWGFQDRQLQVQVDPEKLRARHVSLLQVIETAGNSLWVSPLTFLEASTPGTGGFVDTANQRLGVYHVSPIKTASNLGRVRVEGTDRPLELRDVANVVENHQPLIGDARTNGGPGLLLVVEKLPNASTLDVTRRVESAIGAMQPGLSGIEFNTHLYRPAGYIERSINNLQTGLLLGAILLALAVAALVFRLRTTLVCLVAIPLSLVAATLVLFALGTTMNALVLAGLAAALLVVVDDAVIGIDGIVQRRRQPHPDDERSGTAHVVLEATLATRSATAYATVAVALSTLPLFFMNGMAGSFFPHVAVGYLVAVASSMVVALTVTPAVSLLLAGSSFDREAPLARLVHRGYGSVLGRLLAKPLPVYLAAAAIVAAALATAPFLHSSLLPTFKEDQVLVHWDGPPGTSLPEMDRITARASRELRTLPGVDSVGAHSGRAITGDQVIGANSAEIWVGMDPRADRDATLASIRNVVSGYPGFSRKIETYSNERAQDVLSRSRDDLVVRVYGEELGVLRQQARRVEQAAAAVSGVAKTHVDLPPQEPTLRIEVDLEKAQQHGIKPGDVRRAAATLISGIVVGSLFEQQKVFDVVVWGAPDTRSDPTRIRRLLIDTPEGGHVRLGQVATVQVAASPATIRRQAVSRYLDVAADVSGRSRGAVANDIEEALGRMQFPLEYHAEVLVPARQPLGRLIAVALTAAVGIFLLFHASLGTWRRATLMFASLPMALTGGVVAILATDRRALSFASIIGLIAVLGLAIRNVSLLVVRLGAAETEEHERRDAVMRASLDRVVPVVTTALAAGVALLPVLAMGGRAGFELLHPLAIVLLGGIATSTVVTLFVVPALCLNFGFGPERAPEAVPAKELGSELPPAADVPGPVAPAAAEATALPGESA